MNPFANCIFTGASAVSIESIFSTACYNSISSKEQGKSLQKADTVFRTTSICFT